MTTKWNAINAGTFHWGAGILHRIQQVTEYYSWEEQIYKSLYHLIQDSRGGCSFQASQAVGQRRSGDWKIYCFSTWSEYVCIFHWNSYHCYSRWSQWREVQPACSSNLFASQSKEWNFAWSQIKFASYQTVKRLLNEIVPVSINFTCLEHTMYYIWNVASEHIWMALISCSRQKVQTLQASWHG